MPAYPAHFDYEEPDEHEPICQMPVTPHLLEAIRTIRNHLVRQDIPADVRASIQTLDDWRTEAIRPDDWGQDTDEEAEARTDYYTDIPY